MQPDEEHSRFLLHVEDRATGYPRRHTVGVEFISTVEYRTLMANRRDMPAIAGELIVTALSDLVDEPSGELADTANESLDGPAPSLRAATSAASKEVRLRSTDELVDYFIAAGKKGVAINRYKGLGEMNPEQLWETTMDPTIRTLLQVRAEDHTEADLMFTTLMGDQVEPRRKFIEDNALDVKNLDV